MPSFSDLRSDYPLNFSLFEYLFSGVLKHRFVATVLPARLVGLHSRICETVWPVSWVLAHAVPSYSRDFPDNNGKPYCILLENRTHLTAQCCLSHTLAQATPSVAQIRSRLVAPLAHPAEHRCTSSRANIGSHFREFTAALRLNKSAECTVVDVQMLSTSRGHSHELLAYSLDCLSAHRRSICEVSSYELTASLLSGKSPACDVLDVDDLSIPHPHSSPIAVPGERREAAGTAHEMRTRYTWLSMDGLPWFVCLISAGGGEVRPWRLLHKRICVRCPGRRSGGMVSWRIPTQYVTVRTERSRSSTRPNRLKYSSALGNLLGQGERKSIDTDKEHIMFQSRGSVSFYPLFTAEDIGLRKDASVEHAIKVFLYIGEAIASRWVQMPQGVLLLQAVPDNPQSGAIYLYDRERQIFYFTCFDQGRDDSLSVEEFEQLVTEYDLVSWTANPALLPAFNQPARA